LLIGVIQHNVLVSLQILIGEHLVFELFLGNLEEHFHITFRVDYIKGQRASQVLPHQGNRFLSLPALVKVHAPRK